MTAAVISFPRPQRPIIDAPNLNGVSPGGNVLIMPIVRIERHDERRKGPTK